MSRATAMTPEDRRQAIIEAVQPLLLTQGPSLSTRQIAEAAGVAEGTLFRVFESKQELLAAAALVALRTETSVQQLQHLSPGSPLREQVIAILEILQSEIIRTRALSTTLLHPPDGESPLPGRTHHHKMFNLHERRQRLTDAVTSALDGYADELALPPHTASQVLLAMAFATSFDLTDNNSLRGAADVADVVLHGIYRGNQ